jgi:hypothetical protein
MSPRSKLGLVLLGTAVGAGCSRTPEPPAFEKSAQAAAATIEPSAAPAASAPAVPALPAPGPKRNPNAPSIGSTRAKIKHVIVIAMENHDADEIYSDTVNAPYLHSLLEQYAHAGNFEDELPLEVPSEPHYVWMEAGTHHFSDATFLGDDPPSPSVSTGSTKHLVTQIKNAKGLSWMSYQEGMNEETGACPIAISGFYAPKHNPFIFFRDIAGDPPSKSAAYCAAHHKPYSALERDLQGELASYVFITPDMCHDMHWQRGCPQENPIRTGDQWLKAELPRLISYADQHDGVIFITFDEGGSTPKLPFFAIGSMVKPNYVGMERYTHSSQLKSIELVLGLPPLATVASSNDLSDLFKPGAFP